VVQQPIWLHLDKLGRRTEPDSTKRGSTGDGAATRT